MFGPCVKRYIYGAICHIWFMMYICSWIPRYPLKNSFSSWVQEGWRKDFIPCFSLDNDLDHRNPEVRMGSAPKSSRNARYLVFGHHDYYVVEAYQNNLQRIPLSCAKSNIFKSRQKNNKKKPNHWGSSSTQIQYRNKNKGVWLFCLWQI